VRRAGHMMGFEIEGRPAGEGQLNVTWLLDKLGARDRNPERHNRAVDAARPDP